MSLLEEMTPYIDKETNLVTAPDGGRDNLVLYAGRMARLLSQEERDVYREKVADAFQMLQISGYPGLLRRYPEHRDENSPDNFIGGILLSVHMDLDYHHWMNYYVKSHFWMYNTKTPGTIRWSNWGFIKDWYYKHIGIPPLIKVAVGDKLNAWDVFAYKLAIKFLMLTAKGTSDICLQDDMNSIMRGHNESIDHTIMDFDKWVIEKHGGLKAVYSEFFGAEHPFTKRVI